MEKLILQRSQIGHYRRVMTVLEHWFIYLDKSPTGSGKTFVTMAVAKSCGFQVMVVCPSILESKWRELCDIYQIPLVDTISFQKLAGRKDKLSHSYLVRTNNTYSTGKDLLKVLEKPTLLVIDEVHSTKNSDSLRSHAVHALIKELIKHPESRAALLSATPFDKECHAESLLRMTGLMITEGYDQNHGHYFKLTGARRAYNICCRWDPGCKGIPLPTRKKDYDHFCYNLVLKTVIPRISSKMPAPVLDFPHDLANGFYFLDPGELKLLKEAKHTMLKGIKADGERFLYGKINWWEINTALAMLEKIKVSIMIRLARDALQVPNSKIILAAHYLETVSLLQEAFAGPSTKTMIGEISQDERISIIKSFQEPNLNTRILIINPSVGGTGIDLDDIYGGFPRFLFLLPTYEILKIIQTVGRIYRALTKSQPITRIIYAKDYEEECPILTNLCKKTEILKEILEDLGEIQLPGDYPKYIEPSGP
jgi:superfamily II DNA or RNA helicase